MKYISDYDFNKDFETLLKRRIYSIKLEKQEIMKDFTFEGLIELKNRIFKRKVEKILGVHDLKTYIYNRIEEVQNEYK